MGCFKVGDYNGNIVILNKIVPLQKAELGDEHADVAWTYRNIALSHEKIGELSQSIEASIKRFEITKSAFGLEHSATAASCYDSGRIFLISRIMMLHLNGLVKHLKFKKKPLETRAKRQLMQSTL